MKLSGSFDYQTGIFDINKGILSHRDITASFIDDRVQYRRLIPASVARTSASFWLYEHPWITDSSVKRKIGQAHE